jgi:hypothetical protein
VTPVTPPTCCGGDALVCDLWLQYGTAGCTLQLWTVAAAVYFKYVALVCVVAGVLAVR